VSVLSDPWKFSSEYFPRSGGAEEKLPFLLNYAVLAPSGQLSLPSGANSGSPSQRPVSAHDKLLGPRQTRSTTTPTSVIP
jgi:hypothetical protein